MMDFKTANNLTSIKKAIVNKQNFRCSKVLLTEGLKEILILKERLGYIKLVNDDGIHLMYIVK